ncbi:hypothetical protein IQ266_21640 [filamentous cyanobacterium LEGE 11480]|uniref:DUF7933 domain-containing protein n=1 Tax=Romeriopsis navalis LEGE 11480 TaxID=2777977 RepID=A0A928Z521_9CYAN|nr:hypothetical protein [Romeriopsis navalis]MBE9032344.1 hypothetical protein [Romeriopsis navalis LEGE 11480]
MKPLQELRKLHPRNFGQRLPWLIGIMTGGAIVLQAPIALADILPSASFSPINVTQGSTATLSITFNNDQLTPVTGMGLTNNLPAGLRLSSAPNPILSNSCNGTVTAVPLSTSFSLAGGDIPARIGSTAGQCTIQLEVIGFSGGNQVVTIAPNDITSTSGDTNAQASNATLEVQALQDLGTVITFGPTLIPMTGASAMTVQFNNPNNIAITGVDLSSLLPAGLQITNSGLLTNTCGNTLTATGGPPPTGFDLTNVTIPASGCSFSWSIEGVLPGTTSEQSFSYSIPGGSITSDQFVSNNAGSDTLTVQQGLRIEQQLSRSGVSSQTVNEGGTLTVFEDETATLTLILSNAGGALSNVNLNQALPAGLVIADNVTSSTCGSATITAAPGNTSFSFVNGTMPAATTTSIPTCEVQVNVKAATAGTYTNNIAINTINNDQASQNLNASTISLNVQSIAANGTGIGTQIQFFGNMNNAFYASNQISAGNEARMRIRLTNDSGIALSGVGFGAGGVQLPSNVVLAANPNPTTNCTGGTASTAGTDIVNLAGASMTRRQTCDVFVSVVSQIPATYTANAIAGSFVSTEGKSNAAAAGNLQVLDFINLEQSFIPTTVAASATGNPANMKIKITNAAAAASAGTALAFQLAGGLEFAAAALVSNSCGGTVTLPAGGNQFTLAGATVPASTGQGLGDDGFCEIEYTVSASGTPGSITNTIPAGALTNGAGQSNTTAISAQLNLADIQVVLNQQILNITPGDPNNGSPIVSGGEPAELTVVVRNDSNINLTNLGFTNNLPGGMIVYGPPNQSSTCNNITFAPVANSTNYTVSGISLNAGQTCELKLQVTNLVPGNTNNTIPAKAITSTEGGTNPDPSVTSLTVLANATLNKTFTPASVAAGGISQLKLDLINANNINLTNVGLPDVFPSGMVVADTPNITNTCGGTVSAAPGANQVVLSGATMTQNAICTITVDVTSLTAQQYTNTIPANSLTSTEAFTNARDISAILDVTGTSIVRPGMRLVKRITEIDGTAITGVFNFTPASGPDDDNAPNWPGPIDGTAGISSFLQGAFQGNQIAQQGNVQVGSVIEYTGYFLSDGTGPANTAQLCDFLPANTDFVANSFSGTLGSGAAITGQYLPDGSTFPGSCKGTNNGSGAVVVNLGNVVQSTGAGTPNTSHGSFKFKLTVK